MVVWKGRGKTAFPGPLELWKLQHHLPLPRQPKQCPRAGGGDPQPSPRALEPGTALGRAGHHQGPSTCTFSLPNPHLWATLWAKGMVFHAVCGGQTSPGPTRVTFNSPSFLEIKQVRAQSCREIISSPKWSYSKAMAWVGVISAAPFTQQSVTLIFKNWKWHSPWRWKFSDSYRQNASYLFIPIYFLKQEL